MCLFRPGGIVKLKAVDRARYDHVADEVAAGRYAPKVKDITFSLDDFNAAIDGYDQKLEEVLDGH